METPTAASSNEELVQNIISTQDISTYFQPVVSITGKSIVGFEAFSRGGGGTGACAIAPDMLFDHDLSPLTQRDIDRLCREKALDKFQHIHKNHKGLLLYINMNPDILAHVNLQDKFLYQQVCNADIAPASIAIECPMSIQHLDLLTEFRNVYCKLDFKVCLDGCAVNSPFTFIASQLRPQFIKINRTFFGTTERTATSAIALEALTRLAERLGISVVAQGVENEEESLHLLLAGVHLQQGYYYTKDTHDRTEDQAGVFLKKIITTHEKYKKLKREAVQRKKEKFSLIFRNATSICARLAGMPANQFEGGCRKLVAAIPDTLSLFVLNNAGVQITERIYVPGSLISSMSSVLMETRKGSEQSAQDYVMNLSLGYERFVTPPFISPFSGEEACIISKSIFNEEGKQFTVCIETPYPR